jgi:hypothetical protein
VRPTFHRAPSRAVVEKLIDCEAEIGEEDVDELITDGADDVDGKEKEKDKENVVVKKARKINALAHANFRKLKIKSKGQGRGGGKFGRRR